MRIQVLGWAEYINGSRSTHERLLAWKREQFSSVGWGGISAKWGGTGNIDLPVTDDQIPLGCLSLIDGQPAGAAFLIMNDLQNYAVDRSLADPFIAEDSAGEVANPWFAGHIVDQRFRRQGLARRQEKWIVERAMRLADQGVWTHPRRLWLFTERQPFHFLPEMYQRSGWQVHRNFAYEGLERWVMFFNF